MEINFMSITNKRVSQLIEMSPDEVQPNDLLLIIDTTAHESKNITVLDFETYLRGIGNITTLAYTASYILGSGVSGYVNLAYLANTSSFSNYSLIGSQSFIANTASYALSASAIAFTTIPTASYLAFSPNNGTSSYSINSATASVANVATYLNYFNGNNGTASYAITTEAVLNTTFAQTASYVNTTIASVSSASHANVSDSTLGGTSDFTNFLNFSPNNGTASYAMAALSIASFIAPQGIFLSTSQSSNIAQVDDIDVVWSTTKVARTPIEAFGTIDIPFTSSMPTTGTLSLNVLDRNSGYNTVIDCTPINFSLSPTVGAWGLYDSGSVSMPFSLAGQPSLYGSYLVYVSASNGLNIDSTRNVRFNIATESDTFLVGQLSSGPITFSAVSSNPFSPVLFSFTSTDGGPFTDTAPGINYTQSLGKEIFTITSLGQNVGTINYFWTVSGSISASFSNNTDFYSLSGIPNTLQYLSCNNNILFQLYSMASSSLLYLDCDTNRLSSLPALPNSMSYINCNNNIISNISSLPATLSYFDCSSNNLTSLPSSLPYGLTVFLAGNNPSLTTIPSVLTDTIITMSLDNDSALSQISYMPMSLSYFSINYCSQISSVPSTPVGIVYYSAQSCSLSETYIDNTLTPELYNNVSTYAPRYNNGILDIRGNGGLDPIAVGYINSLVNNYGWTAYYD